MGTVLQRQGSLRLFFRRTQIFVETIAGTIDDWCGDRDKEPSAGQRDWLPYVRGSRRQFAEEHDRGPALHVTDRRSPV